MREAQWTEAKILVNPSNKRLEREEMPVCDKNDQRSFNKHGTVHMETRSNHLFI